MNNDLLSFCSKYLNNEIGENEISELDMQPFFETPMIYYKANLRILIKETSVLNDFENVESSRGYIVLSKGWECHYPALNQDCLCIVNFNEKSFCLSTFINKNIHESIINTSNNILELYIAPTFYFSLTGRNYSKNILDVATIRPISNPCLLKRQISSKEIMLNERSKVASKITFKILNFVPEDNKLFFDMIELKIKKMFGKLLHINHESIISVILNFKETVMDFLSEFKDRGEEIRQLVLQKDNFVVYCKINIDKYYDKLQAKS